MQPLKIPFADIPRITGESLSVARDAVNLGHLETFLVGRRRFARPEAIRRWIDFLEAESQAGRPVMYRARKRAQGSERAVTDQPDVDVPFAGSSTGQPGANRAGRARSAIATGSPGSPSTRRFRLRRPSDD